jgi:hypothetical protein
MTAPAGHRFEVTFTLTGGARLNGRVRLSASGQLDALNELGSELSAATRDAGGFYAFTRDQGGITAVRVSDIAAIELRP